MFTIRYNHIESKAIRFTYSPKDQEIRVKYHPDFEHKREWLSLIAQQIDYLLSGYKNTLRGKLNCKNLDSNNFSISFKYSDYTKACLLRGEDNTVSIYYLDKENLR